VSINRISWNESADRAFLRALPDSLIRSIVADEVRTGVSRLWLCKSAEHTAYCITRLDNNPREFVIVAFEGTGLHLFAPSFIHAADSQNLAIRAHIANPVMTRLLRKYGFRPRETILIRECA